LGTIYTPSSGQFSLFGSAVAVASLTALLDENVISLLLMLPTALQCNVEAVIVGPFTSQQRQQGLRAPTVV